MNICIITYDYPYKKNIRFPFVKQLAEEFAKQGHQVSVIAPFNLLHNRILCKKVSVEIGRNGGYVTVLRPRYISLPKIGGYELTTYFHKYAVNIALKSLPVIPDLIYCHFWSSGYEVYEYARCKKIPLFVASGESSVDDMFPKDQRKSEYLEYVKGAIFVSSKNLNESMELGIVRKENCAVFPNSVDNNVFRVYPKEICRNELGIPLNKFIVSYVGWFNDRKGSSRLSKAIETIDSGDVYSIYIGSGNEKPTCNNIIFMGSLSHDKIPWYLCASDVFILPTKREGCCNAIVEAMACGLPIVSSNLPFNWDILNDGNSILIDPDNINEIRAAIERLRDDEMLRDRLRSGAIETARSLTIDNRAKSILNFIQHKLNE